MEFEYIFDTLQRSDYCLQGLECAMLVTKFAFSTNKSCSLRMTNMQINISLFATRK